MNLELQPNRRIQTDKNITWTILGVPLQWRDIVSKSIDMLPVKEYAIANEDTNHLSP
jgi:hypothetical protein